MKVGGGGGGGRKVREPACHYDLSFQFDRVYMIAGVTI